VSEVDVRGVYNDLCSFATLVYWMTKVTGNQLNTEKGVELKQGPRQAAQRVQVCPPVSECRQTLWGADQPNVSPGWLRWRVRMNRTPRIAWRPLPLYEMYLEMPRSQRKCTAFAEILNSSAQLKVELTWQVNYIQVGSMRRHDCEQGTVYWEMGTVFQVKWK
jgi:hypothetical protein